MGSYLKTISIFLFHSIIFIHHIITSTIRRDTSFTRYNIPKITPHGSLTSFYTLHGSASFVALVAHRAAPLPSVDPLTAN